MSKLSDDKQFVSFAMPKDDVVQVERWAGEFGQTRSAFLRDVIKAGLRKLENVRLDKR